MKQPWSRLLATVVAFTLTTSLASAAEPTVKPAKAGATPAITESTKPADTQIAAKQVLVDINTASDAELRSIPGLGDAYAAKIVANRPYANKKQLVSRKVLPESVYEKIKDSVVARQPKKDNKK